MKKFTFVLFVFLLMSLNSSAQNAVRWNFDITPSATEEGIYNLTFKADIGEKWHMYSQHLPSPGEGPLPLIFAFDENKDIELIGEVTEETDKIHKVKDEAFGVDVTYFDGKVTFTQKVKLKTSKTKLSGYISYMTCNDEMCLPNDLEFTVPIGAN